MPFSVKPVKFYGSSLPRPRIYTDMKLNEERIDPPVSVLDPFMSWAADAHWSMGGLSFNRFRHQGKIEGNINKLREEIDESPPVNRTQVNGANWVDSPPLWVEMEDGIESREGVKRNSASRKRRRLVKKYGDEE